MDKISEHGLLEVMAGFDELGGASLGLAAWELFTTEDQLSDAWEHALTSDWIASAGTEPVYNERLWRLTEAGWAAYRRRLWEDGTESRER